MANARIQAHRVAAVRHLALATVDGLIAKYTVERGLGFSGEQGVNVLELNLALDRLTGGEYDVAADARRQRKAGGLALPAGDRQTRADRQPLKLDPRVQLRNPVMFVVEIGSVITTITWLIQVFGGKPLGGGHDPAWYTLSIAIWLWLTVVFANMAEAFAEGRGRAQADTLRNMRKETVAKMRDGSTKAASELSRGDVVVVRRAS